MVLQYQAVFVYHLRELFPWHTQRVQSQIRLIRSLQYISLIRIKLRRTAP